MNIYRATARIKDQIINADIPKRFTEKAMLDFFIQLGVAPAEVFKTDENQNCKRENIDTNIKTLTITLQTDWDSIIIEFEEEEPPCTHYGEVGYVNWSREDKYFEVEEIEID